MDIPNNYSSQQAPLAQNTMQSTNSTELIHRYLLGDITDDEVNQLDRLLANSPELRREFTLAAATDAGLREVAFERAAEPVQLRTQTGSTKKYFWATCISLAVAVVVMLCFGLAFNKPEPTIATLVSSENAAWESSLPTMPGSKLATGLLNLKSGVATIRFDSGAEVVLEAPAELRLMTPMKAKLLTGAAVIDVPDSAIGFVIETPDGYAIDYGTRFAVRVDQQEQQSTFEVIDGEIAVRHPPSGEEVRLTGQATAATVSERSIVVVDLEKQEDTEVPSARVIRIGTNGRTGSAMRRDHKRKKYIQREFLSVKRTETGKWDHRSFFSFDLTAIDLNQVESARLRLNLVPSTRGTVSRLPKMNRFGIYGLINQTKADWQIDSLWDESPGPEDGILLGTFEIPRSQQRGSFGIQNAELLSFLKDHPDKPVTLILVRETSQVEGVGPGLTHLFASDSHPESVGPMLEFSLVE